MNRKVSIRIRVKDAGQTVLELLSHRFTYHDRNRWETLILAGKIRLNGKSSLPDVPLTSQDILTYEGFDETEPPVRIDYDILFEDDALLVVNKPGNLPCHPGGRYFNHTLWHLLTTRYEGAPLYFVNRIDRETSGIVLVAKTLFAARDCGRQFAAGSVQKRYLVAVFGDFPAEPVCAKGGLCRDDISPVHKKQRFLPSEAQGRDARPLKLCRTGFQLLRRNEGLSLLSAVPLTGRLHQIRATLFSLGYPVVGDKIYGPDDTLFLRFIDDRLTAEDRPFMPNRFSCITRTVATSGNGSRRFLRIWPVCFKAKTNASCARNPVGAKHFSPSQRFMGQTDEKFAFYFF
jgi:23S rRNA pseudouridine955/2504/2580 synthase/23S rRNA pseudouridine1911/1915/1917 synthase